VISLARPHKKRGIILSHLPEFFTGARQSTCEWRGLEVNAVEDLSKLIILRFGAQGITIPSRVFPDQAARAAFVTAAGARIKGATVPETD